MRGGVKVRKEGSTLWQTVQELYEGATNKAISLGKAAVGKDKKSRNTGTLYLIKKNKKGRKKPLSKQRYPQEERQYGQMYRDPWLLVSSLEDSHPKTIVDMYALRMQIEQNFRDIKSSHYGFGLEESGSQDLMRLGNLLLIALVALFMAFLLGLCAEKSSLHRAFQANTVKKRRVLSLVFLGKRVWERGKAMPFDFIQKTVSEFISWCGEIDQNG
jgi:hypothetical protein